MSDLIFFNADDGYAEAFLRGLRKGFLTESNYNVIRNTHSLKDLKTVLLDTDYAEYVKDWNETDTTSLKLLLKRKLADEVDYIQTVAGPDLQKFIQMIRHKYMIDNVINIIEGSKNRTAKDIIHSRSEPLGYLPEIQGLVNLEARKIDELYEDVLIDTEVGYYFSTFLEEILENSDVKHLSVIQNYLNELKPEKIKNYLKKIWLEHFYLFCKTLGSTTAEIMEDLLKFEADCQAIQIVYNSLAYDFNQFQEEERRRVIPNFGRKNYN
jgi:V-type H+-transporting ATPase subunit d